MNQLICICTNKIRNIDCPIHKVEILGYDLIMDEHGYVITCLCDCNCKSCDTTFKLAELAKGRRIAIYLRNTDGTQTPLTLTKET